MASTFTAKLRFAWWWLCVVAKLGFASTLVIGILVAYGMKFSVTSAGPFTLGLYGETLRFAFPEPPPPFLQVTKLHFSILQESSF